MKKFDTCHFTSTLNSYPFGYVTSNSFQFGNSNKEVLLDEISFLEVVCVNTHKFNVVGFVISLICCGFVFFFEFYFLLLILIFPLLYFPFFFDRKYCYIQIIFKIPSRSFIDVDLDSIDHARAFVRHFNNYLHFLNKIHNK